MNRSPNPDYNTYYGPSKIYRNMLSSINKNKTQKNRCLLVNARSIVNKISEINLALIYFKLDLMIITETWLKDDIDIQGLLLIDNYKIYNINRQGLKKGGGCAFIYKKELNFECTFSKSCFNCEILVLNPKSNKNLKIISLYRPPNTSIENTKKTFKKISEHITSNTVLVGDFNIGPKDIMWSNGNPKPHNLLGATFIEFFHKFGFLLKTPAPTRNQSWLDLCLTNNEGLITNCTIHEDLITSDHEGTFFSMEFSRSTVEKPNKYFRKYELPEIFSFNAYLSSTPNLLLQGFSLEDKYNIFLQKTIECQNRAIPLYTKRDHIPRYPTALKSSIMEKRCLWRLLKIDKEKHRQNYDSICLHIRIQTNKFKVQQEQKFLQKGNMNLYKYVRKHLKPPQDIPVLLYGNKIVYDDASKCNIFAELFSSHFTNFKILQSDLPKIDFNHQEILDLDLSTITVENLLKNLPDKDGTSPDDISYRFLKKCHISLTPFITELFRLSLDSGKIPIIWKHSIVIPLFKKGDKKDPANYRPISLTCSLCRVLERLIAEKISDFLIENNILSEHQFGFMKKRSTKTQLISVLEDWYNALSGKYNIDCVYIDLKRAFDVIPHDLLLYKLYAIGIRGKLHSWISDFLTDRTFQVKIGNNFSSKFYAKSGVPQGSVLGPLLFIIYINDLPNAISNDVKIKLFADDNKLYNIHKTKNERKKMITALDDFANWCSTWKVEISVQKSFILYLGKNNPKDQYKLGDNVLGSVDTIRDLGILINNELKFHEHISKITRSAYLRMRIFFRFIKSRRVKTWVHIYKSYIRPLLEYAPEIWSPNTKSEILRVEKCQKYFTRIALKKCRLPNLPYEERLKLFELPTLEQRRIIFDLVLAFKIINNHTHLDRDKYFRESRVKNSIPFQRMVNKRSLYRYSFSNRVVNHWNKLDKEIISLKSTDTFRQKITEKILSENMCCSSGAYDILSL